MGTVFKASFILTWLFLIMCFLGAAFYFDRGLFAIIGIGAMFVGGFIAACCMD